MYSTQLIFQISCTVKAYMRSWRAQTWRNGGHRLDSALVQLFSHSLKLAVLHFRCSVLLASEVLFDSLSGVRLPEDPKSSHHPRQLFVLSCVDSKAEHNNDCTAKTTLQKIHLHIHTKRVNSLQRQETAVQRVDTLFFSLFICQKFSSCRGFVWIVTVVALVSGKYVWVGQKTLAINEGSEPFSSYFVDLKTTL